MSNQANKIFNPSPEFIEKILAEVKDDDRKKLMQSMVNGEFIRVIFDISRTLGLIPDNQDFIPVSLNVNWTTHDIQFVETDLSETQASVILKHLVGNHDADKGITTSLIHGVRAELYHDEDFIILATPVWTGKDGQTCGNASKVEFNLSTGDISGLEGIDDIIDLKLEFEGSDTLFECASSDSVIFNSKEELIDVRSKLVEDLGEEGLHALRYSINAPTMG